ncbi:hypothetical protein [uncultured Polaribacter sp.]|uniref:hypothetical protein n=1 Tax=uncultured Polaribacter sp. TaxID=174711 RepID=UPI002602B951|nr:hypothetical protein [uncultured Polaribacter sp.]
MKKFKLLVIFALFAFSATGQNLAMNTLNNYGNTISTVEKEEIVPLLNETKYTYKYKGENVVVVFSESKHVEYFNEGKYFIKSDISWVSEDECYMTLQESNLPNFPFKKGIKLKMKITKIKRGYIFYESTLGGRTWEGRMRKLY